MPAIITNALRRYNAENFEESFKETSPDNMYIFLGRSATAWADEENPDTPADSPKEKLSLYDEIIGLKKVGTVDVIPIITRIDWKIHTVYDEYDDEIEIVGGIDSETGSPYQYYVLTDNFNVYKCISNNNGAASTVKPSDTSVNSFKTSDGYIWKYMFTVSTTHAINYLSDAHIPLRTLLENDGSDQWIVQSLATDGSIEHIVVESGGSGYDPLDPPQIVITGDGTGATAAPTIDDTTGAITKIEMTDIGSGYTYASVSVDNTSVVGSGALARAVVSPIGGHGSDPQRELGSTMRMVAGSFDGSEDGNVPLGVDYRQVGILLNPFRLTTGTKLTLTGIAGKFDEGDVITGGISSATATVVKYEYETGVIYATSVLGSFTNGETVSSTGGSGTVSNISLNQNIPAVEQFIDPADLLKGSGNIVYVNNRTKVTRFEEQEERVKLIITF